MDYPLITELFKNCEPEFSYLLSELFNMCLKEPCFPDCWKVWSLYLRMLGKGLHLKATTLLSLVFVVSKVSENLVNNKHDDHLEKCDLFFISNISLGLLDQLRIF